MPVDSIDTALAWYREHINQKLSPKLLGSTAPPPASESKAAVDALIYDLNFARAKREHHEANLAELKERQVTGELVDAARVRLVVTNLAATARSALEKIPDKLADRIAAEVDPVACHSLMTEEIDLALADLSSRARTMKFEAGNGGV